MEDLPFSKHKAIRDKTITSCKFQNMHDTEQTLQRQCEQFLKLQKIRYIHIPELAYQNAYIPAGIPDLILYKPADDKYCVAVFVELKSKKGKVRQSQQKFARQVPVFICRSFEHFQQIVSEFLNEV